MRQPNALASEMASCQVPAVWLDTSPHALEVGSLEKARSGRGFLQEMDHRSADDLPVLQPQLERSAQDG